jgi:hypothetical protein
MTLFSFLSFSFSLFISSPGPAQFSFGPWPCLLISHFFSLFSPHYSAFSPSSSRAWPLFFLFLFFVLSTSLLPFHACFIFLFLLPHPVPNFLFFFPLFSAAAALLDLGTEAADLSGLGTDLTRSGGSSGLAALAWMRRRMAGLCGAHGVVNMWS